ncbi:MAG: DUF4097 family beta strand repeat-containing protein [Lachnospiraceae bacterium]|nr:DUF4097 family beta strand repeat-containing protein [Lachnospiraceae bacterium]
MKITKYILAVACIIGTALAITGCGGLESLVYPDPDSYKIGNAEIAENVEHIDIDWISGDVKIVTDDVKTLSIREETGRDISDKQRVHWRLNGSTLSIKFCASGIKPRHISTLNKDLTVTIPEKMALSSVDIDAASAPLDIRNLSAEDVTLSTASGDILFTGENDRLRATSASGRITISQTGTADTIEADTASGDVELILENAENVAAHSASGRISAEAVDARSLRLESVSGNVTAVLGSAPKTCALNTVSGKVSLTLPENAGFTARIGTVSGDFDSDLALKKNGDTYINGDGRADITMDTTSGDMKIMAGKSTINYKSNSLL